MTNEEAIEYNKNLREYMRITDTESEFKFLKENYEALDMAIKVLEQIPDLKETYNKGYKDGQKALAFHLELCKEEQEPCEDCISREAVLDMVEDMTDQFGVGHRVVTEGMISLLPPVTPKPKTDVLDKIRAEIDSAKMPKNRMSFFRDGIDTALEIIDKYKVRK